MFLSFAEKNPSTLQANFYDVQMFIAYPDIGGEMIPSLRRKSGMVFKDSEVLKIS